MTKKKKEKRNIAQGKILIMSTPGDYHQRQS